MCLGENSVSSVRLCISLLLMGLLLVGYSNVRIQHSYCLWNGATIQSTNSEGSVIRSIDCYYDNCDDIICNQIQQINITSISINLKKIDKNIPIITYIDIYWFILFALLSTIIVLDICYFADIKYCSCPTNSVDPY